MAGGRWTCVVELARLRVELTHRVGWEERALKAESLIVGMLHADENAYAEAKDLVERWYPELDHDKE